jgi:hypothetical protein
MPPDLDPQIAPDVHRHLRGKALTVYDRIISVSLAQAKKARVPVRRVMVSNRRSWEGNFREITVHVIVDASLPESLALWDAIGSALGGWLKKQDEDIQLTFSEAFSLFVEPDRERSVRPA